MGLLDLLDGHDEEAADDGQGDGGREGEVVAEGHHDGGHDDRAAHLTKGGAHVQNAQILASLFLVRQHINEQSLIDRGVDKRSRGQRCQRTGTCPGWTGSATAWRYR